MTGISKSVIVTALISSQADACSKLSDCCKYFSPRSNNQDQSGGQISGKSNESKIGGKKPNHQNQQIIKMEDINISIDEKTNQKASKGVTTKKSFLKKIPKQKQQEAIKQEKDDWFVMDELEGANVNNAQLEEHLKKIA
jgi:hypothetical protein